ncbi:MAG TPA: glycoside hydrolase family 57 protein [Gemmatimonadales bacterium]|nr:glycoside hydrolase family 57 protein [Gemmatimonadales bacterium]
MPDICFYFQIHQPYRLRRFRVFDIGSGSGYFDPESNRAILRRVAEKCYLPANRVLREAVERSEGRFRFALSLSGVLLDQLAADAPDVLESFQRLVATGGVELLGETSHHSLAALRDPEEFRAQVSLHRQAVGRHFGQTPTVFRNTELLYDDAIAAQVGRLGFQGMLLEGTDRLLSWRSPNYVYAAAAAPTLRLLPRNFRLSDDVGFRFSNRSWDAWPLTADRWAEWVARSAESSVHVYLDYETFGEHHWADTGIFDFLRHLPDALARRGVASVHPSTLAARMPWGTLSAPVTTSWADAERDTSAWLGNRIQRAAADRHFRLGARVRETGDPTSLETWRRLGTSDHFYYMATKHLSDGEVHQYFSPFDSPYDAFIAYMNALTDLERECAAAGVDPRWTAEAEMAVAV